MKALADITADMGPDLKQNSPEATSAVERVDSITHGLLVSYRNYALNTPQQDIYILSGTWEDE